MVTNGDVSRRRQVIYIITPFCLFLLGLILFNLGGYGSEVDGVSIVVPTAVVPTAVQTEQIVSVTTTPSLLPTATVYAPPVYDEQTAVTLLGPPDGTIFRLQDAVVFYWTWPHPLTDDQQLTLYFQNDGKIIPVASLIEPNLGTTYRATLSLADLLIEETLSTTAAIQWQIRLESSFADSPLTSSPIRTITILPQR